ncbi:hypothetical protein O6R08_04285 [Cutibacterium equinum]|uniref:Uncharacterized protein n=1 Tax=Cutibacterium equinum TaxID=3016342 RepID=A0ABY7R083_9ACTN|nr:hypothetical protein [Cutibacterium equinum]WCC80706.1 hypothetical protein O6R08_04285 [Cutibacterium equinum]
MGVMWWTRGPSREEMTRVRAVLGFDDVMVLASGKGEEATVIAVTEGLVVLTEETDSAVAWHEIVHGGWNGDTSTLTWDFLDGSGAHVVLEKPGKIPEVFRARVTESIAATRTVPVRGGDVLIAGRIPAGHLGDPQGAITWTAMARGSADLNDPETRQTVLEATEALKKEWN